MESTPEKLGCIYTPTKRDDEWTDEEDDLLKEAVEQAGGPYNWKCVSETFGESMRKLLSPWSNYPVYLRDAVQCETRWRQLVGAMMLNAVGIAARFLIHRLLTTCLLFLTL